MKQILIVDDEEQIRVSLRVVLEDLGYGVTEADNGATAFDLAKSQKPHLIVSDVMMENGNGFLLRELLREDEETALIPLILMSGNAQRAGAWQSDPDVEYLEKPFTSSELQSAVERALSRT